MVAGVDDLAEVGVGLVYVGGAALLAGAAYLATPAGQRASASLGEAMYEGSAGAVRGIRDAAQGVAGLFSGEKDKAAATADTATSEETRKCDGPHAGRLQAQGYDRGADPAPVQCSVPWNRECHPPLRAEGLTMLSADLLTQVRAISQSSAGLRGPAFVKMSKYISNSSPPGFTPADSRGWSINDAGRAVRNFGPGVGRNAPRVDLEINRGRAFGDF